jgi:hypothetical protein
MRDFAWQPLLIYPYDVRRHPKRVPTPDILDCPQVQICINAEWASHVDGVLERLLFTDAWEGTEEEVDRAINQVEKLLAQLKVNNMSCCCGNQEPILHRMTEGGKLEVSYDGGETWVPDPADPRLTGTQLPNTVPGTGSDKKCNAATNCVNNIQSAQAEFSNHLEAGETVVSLAAQLALVLIALLFAPEGAPVLIPILITLATALVSLTKTAYDGEFTSPVWDTLLCDIFCNVGSDGQFNQTQYNNLLAAIDTDFSDNVALTFYSVITGWGLVGLNNACITGTAATADCGGCDCADPCAFPDQFFLYGEVTSFVDNGDGTITLEVSSEAAPDTTEAIRWGLLDETHCCEILAFTVIDPAPGSTQGWTRTECGGENGGMDSFVPACYEEIQYIQNFALTTPFHAVITFAASC